MFGKADPEAGQQAPDRILHIHSRFDRNFARPQQSSALLGNTAFDLDALVKSCAGKLRQHGSIVLIGFIVHLAQYSMSLTRINADHRQTALAEFVVKPIRHPAGFQNDAPNVLQVTDQGTMDDIRVSRLLECRLDDPASRSNANRRLVL